MIEIPIGTEMVHYAEQKREKLSLKKGLALNKFGSEYDRILIGYIGESVLMRYLKIEEDQNTFNYDLRYKDKKIEVKTISCKFKPKRTYLATVNSHKVDGVHQQDADYYVFVRILNDKSKAWVLGCCTCNEFFEKGEFIAKGKDFGKFKFVKANATVLPISELRPINQIR